MRSVLVLGAATAILHEVSLLPDSMFVAVLDAMGRQGIFTNILVGRSYEQLARDFTAIPEPLNELLVRPVRRPGRQFLAIEHPELAWRSGPGAGWSERDAQEAVERRYQHAAKVLPWTIARLRQDADFLQTVATLREDGWKDWHILLGVGNVTWNYRAHALYGPHALEDRQLGQRLAYEAENEDSLEIPVEQYSAEKLRSALQMSMVNTLVHYGLDLRQSTPDLPAIEKFLASRYFYWDIDVPHADPFGAGTGDASEAA